MSTAYKCDGCKTLIEDAAQVYQLKRPVSKSEVELEVDVHFWFKKEWDSKRIQADLCKDCQIKVLTQAIEDIKNNKER